MRVLLIESNPEPLKRALGKKGFEIETAKDGQDGDQKARVGDYDIIILDLDAPKQDGATLVDKWRHADIRAHIVVLTSQGTLQQKVDVFSLGADECVVKPFDRGEFSAQLQTLMPGNRTTKGKTLVVFDLEIDLAERTATRAGLAIPLTPREFDLLVFLAQHRGNAVSRATIWEHLYQSGAKLKSNVIDVYVRYLRKKIDKGFDFPLILTCWGQGYMMRGETPAPG